MEDSLVTGLRARDLEGHITYVNPAFCDMVGLAPEELLGKRGPLPYWPPELVDEYSARQSQRVIGTAPPREGFESLFLRKDGTRFPVLVMEMPEPLILRAFSVRENATLDDAVTFIVSPLAAPSRLLLLL